jgi:hypothetical protein
MIRDGVDRAIRSIRKASEPCRDNQAVLTCFQLLGIQLINEAAATTARTTAAATTTTSRSTDGQSAWNSICGLLPHIVGLSPCVRMVQGVAILTLYKQITGRVNCMPYLVGVLVQNARQIGLDRNPQPSGKASSNATAGRLEMRKRLCWSIFNLDM